MKKGTKVGLTLIGLAGLAAAAAVAVKKYQEKYCNGLDIHITRMVNYKKQVID